MKVLLVTGQLAKESVRYFAEESGVKCDVADLPIQVAALMTPKFVIDELGKRALSGYAMVLLPGMMEGNISPVEESLGIKTFKGPRHAADIPPVLLKIDRLKLSKVTPACELLKGGLRKRAEETLRKANLDKRPLRKRGNLLLRHLPVGRDYPMRVMAELSGATSLPDEEIARSADYYLRSGADIISLGTNADHPDPRRAGEIVHLLRERLNVPIAIDTLHLEEARQALISGADLFVGAEANSLETLSAASDKALVVMPMDCRRGLSPKDAEGRVRLLSENILKARNLGFKRVIGDLILDSINSPGLVEALVAYRNFSKNNSNVPLLLGIGNITELLDADTVGANAVLAGIASELGASILLTTEVSDKARGCVRELSIASRMMFLAKTRRSPPKDLGLDLLLLKDKRFREEMYEPSVIEGGYGRIKLARTPPSAKPDKKGVFRIMVDRRGGQIAALHFLIGGKEPDVIVKGATARDLYDTIVRDGLISDPLHAAYLGCELGKAEIALKIGKAYNQDFPLF